MLKIHAEVADDIAMWREELITAGPTAYDPMQHELGFVAASLLTEDQNRLREDAVRRRKARIKPSRQATQRNVLTAIIGVVILGIVFAYRALGFADGPAITIMSVGALALIVNTLLEVTGTTGAGGLVHYIKERMSDAFGKHSTDEQAGDGSAGADPSTEPDAEATDPPDGDGS
jgi:hypothetical protein